VIACESLDEEWGIRLDGFAAAGLRPIGRNGLLAPRTAACELEEFRHNKRGLRVQFLKERRFLRLSWEQRSGTVVEDESS
jgi:hypothetical protein